MTCKTSNNGRRKLAKGLYYRGQVIWARYKDTSGKWRDASTGLKKGDEKRAAVLLAEMKRVTATAGDLGFETSVPTLGRFFDWWIERSKARGKRSWKDDESRLRVHVLPHLRDVSIDEVTPLRLEQVFQRMREADKAQKTVWNAYTATRSLFNEAVKQGVLTHSPCVLGEQELGKMVDKDPEWRESAIFGRDELASLMFDPRVPPDRRIYYAITYMGGRRLGETSGLRVRQVELSDGTELGSMVFARSYSNARTKTNQTVRMPIHPVLDRMLRWWLEVGFQEMFGRDPSPDDFVVPRPPGCRSKFGPCRDKNYTGKKLREVDLVTLGLRRRRTHDLRRSFTSHILQDGGAPHIVVRLTHPSMKKATAFAGYTEFRYEDFCREVAKLSVSVPAEAAAVFALAVGAEGDQPDPDPTTPGGARMPTLHALPRTEVSGRPKLAAVVAAPTKKAQENPGLSGWRRRESNPVPGWRWVSNSANLGA